MKRRKGATASKSLVWRISELAPFGEWVDKRVRVAPKTAVAMPLDKHSSWSTSTHDLMIGAEVTESLGGEYDEFFGQPLKPLTNPPSK